jgi:hypothetical protein
MYDYSNPIIYHPSKPIAMKTNAVSKELEVIKRPKSQPFVSLLLPFDPKMTSKSSIESRLKIILDEVRHELFAHYDFDAAIEVSQKLKTILNSLEYSTHKRSIVVLVSSEEQKVYYLDIPVMEKIIVDNSFRIRQLIQHKKDDKEYLLLTLSQKQSIIYRGKGDTLTQIVLNVASKKEIEERNLIEKVTIALETCLRREALLKKFIKSIDNGLYFILNAFPLSVFILSTKETMACFQQITQNKPFITDYVYGNFENASEDEIEAAVQPYISNWKKVKEMYLVNQLEYARDTGKLEIGIQQVWKAATRKNGRLLVVENSYECQAILGNGLLRYAEEAKNNTYTKDAVEDTIEKVLADGGDVAFVSDGALRDYMRIALISY